MTETEIRKDILEYLGYFKLVCSVRAQQRHNKYRMNRTEAGWPDISGNWYEKALYIEVKRPEGKLTTKQRQFLREKKELGCIAFVAHSVTDVQNELFPAKK